jgi:hypothetical protein
LGPSWSYFVGNNFFTVSYWSPSLRHSGSHSIITTFSLSFLIPEPSHDTNLLTWIHQYQYTRKHLNFVPNQCFIDFMRKQFLTISPSITFPFFLTYIPLCIAFLFYCGYFSAYLPNFLSCLSLSTRMISSSCTTYFQRSSVITFQDTDVVNNPQGFLSVFLQNGLLAVSSITTWKIFQYISGLTSQFYDHCI